jgi:hypothetical protein
MVQENIEQPTVPVNVDKLKVKFRSQQGSKVLARSTTVNAKAKPRAEKTEKVVEKIEKTEVVVKQEVKTEVVVKQEKEKLEIEKKNTEPEMTGKTLELCHKLLNQIMEDIKAPAFNVPVEPDKLGIPEYRFVIKTPMDLGTIKTILGKTRYKDRFKTLRDFAAKVRLVFDNARTFNQSGSIIYNDADYLSKLFESKYSELQKILGLPKSYDPAKEFIPPPPIPPLPVENPIVSNNNRRTANKDGFTSDNKRKRRSASATTTSTTTTTTRQPRPPKNRKTELDQQSTTTTTKPASTTQSVVTLAEKKELHEMLIVLSDNEWAMGKVMELISPTSTSTGTGELEIDVASLPVSTIRKLQRFVKGQNIVLPPSEPPKQQNIEQTFDSEEDYENGDPDIY